MPLCSPFAQRKRPLLAKRKSQHLDISTLSLQLPNSPSSNGLSHLFATLPPPSTPLPDLSTNNLSSFHRPRTSALALSSTLSMMTLPRFAAGLGTSMNGSTTAVPGGSTSSHNVYHPLLPSPRHIKSAESAFITAHIDQLVRANSHIPPSNAMQRCPTLTAATTTSSIASNAVGHTAYSPLLPVLPLTWDQFTHWIAHYTAQQTSLGTAMAQWLESLFSTTRAVHQLVQQLALVRCYLYALHQLSLIEKQQHVLPYQLSVDQLYEQFTRHANSPHVMNSHALQLFFSLPTSTDLKQRNISLYENMSHVMRRDSTQLHDSTMKHTGSISTQTSLSSTSSSALQQNILAFFTACTKLSNLLQYHYSIPIVDINALLVSHLQSHHVHQIHGPLEFSQFQQLANSSTNTTTSILPHKDLIATPGLNRSLSQRSSANISFSSSTVGTSRQAIPRKTPFQLSTGSSLRSYTPHSGILRQALFNSWIQFGIIVLIILFFLYTCTLPRMSRGLGLRLLPTFFIGIFGFLIAALVLLLIFAKCATSPNNV